MEGVDGTCDRLELELEAIISIGDGSRVEGRLLRGEDENSETSCWTRASDVAVLRLRER